MPSLPVLKCGIFFCSVQRSNCYMVCAGDAVNPSSSGRSNSDLEIGCLIDLATGLVTFTANGKELSTVYQVRKTGLMLKFHCPEDLPDLTGHQNKTHHRFLSPKSFFLSFILSPWILY